MTQGRQSNPVKRTARSLIFLALAALSAFNTWVSWVSNSDRYRSVDPNPEYVDQLRSLKPINLFQFIADAAGYREYSPPGQFTRYFVGLFALLTVFFIYLAAPERTTTESSQPEQTPNPSPPTRNVPAEQRLDKKPEPPIATSEPHTSRNQREHLVGCPSCGRTTSVGAQFSGSIRCTCGNTLRIDIISLPATSQINDVPTKVSEESLSKEKRPAANTGIHLGKLESTFPRRAEQLRQHVENGGKLSGSLDLVADKIWKLSQLWLVFLDGADFGLTDDREIYDQIVSLANSHPRCSIEDEANQWMLIHARTMSNFEIATALNCSADSVGEILRLNGNYDDTYRLLVGSRIDPTL